MSAEKSLDLENIISWVDQTTLCRLIHTFDSNKYVDLGKLQPWFLGSFLRTSTYNSCPDCWTIWDTPIQRRLNLTLYTYRDIDPSVSPECLPQYTIQESSKGETAPYQSLEAIPGNFIACVIMHCRLDLVSETRRAASRRDRLKTRPSSGSCCLRIWQRNDAFTLPSIFPSSRSGVNQVAVFCPSELSFVVNLDKIVQACQFLRFSNMERIRGTDWRCSAER